MKLCESFLGLEIAACFQGAVGTKAGAGYFTAALILAGIRPNLIDKWRTAMSILSIVFQDFSVYFFAFLSIHVLADMLIA